MLNVIIISSAEQQVKWRSWMPSGVVKSPSCEQAISAIPLLEWPNSLSVHKLALSETDYKTTEHTTCQQHYNFVYVIYLKRF